MRKGGKNAVILGGFALILGILAVSLSFIAYAKRIKEEDVSVRKDGSCEYKNSPAFVLGILAAIFVLSEQILITTGTACFCCAPSSLRSSTCARIFAIILFLLSWLTFVVTFVGLIVSAIFNNKKLLTSAYSNDKNGDACYNVGKDSKLFLGTTIWCIITVVFGLVSYIISKTTNKE